MRIRQANTDDAQEIHAIYTPYVTDSIISFEEVPPSIEEMTERIGDILKNYAYFVAEEQGQLLGYAYASQHRTRSAYRSSVDVAVYVSKNAHRRGIGRALYNELLAASLRSGYHAAFAGITLPNEASVALHEAMGFRPVGIYREVGRKFEKWHDVGWWQRVL